MNANDLPNCVARFVYHRDLVDADYHLFGSARDLGFVKVAADELDEMGNDLGIAEYHAFAGVSAARAAVDAAASWLNELDELGLRGTRIDFKKEPFSRALLSRRPQLAQVAERLSGVLDQIDEFRQRAQHREGLALAFYATQPGGPTGGWYLTRGLQSPRGEDQHLSTLLHSWARLIEEELCSIVTSMAES